MSWHFAAAAVAIGELSRHRNAIVTPATRCWYDLNLVGFYLHVTDVV